MLYADIPGLSERLSEDHGSVVQQLRENIAILRSQIHQNLIDTKCQGDVLALTGAVVTLVNLAKSCQAMELATSERLDADAVKTLAGNAGKILVEELSGLPNRDELVDKISRRIGSLMVAK